MLTRGIVLRVSPVGESDRLVTILTEKAGVVRAFARNGRAAKEPFGQRDAAVFLRAL